MVPVEHVIDIGPNLLTFLLACVSASGSMIAAVYAIKTHQGIVQANSHLAATLIQQQQANKVASLATETISGDHSAA